MPRSKKPSYLANRAAAVMKTQEAAPTAPETETSAAPSPAVPSEGTEEKEAPASTASAEGSNADMKAMVKEALTELAEKGEIPGTEPKRGRGRPRRLEETTSFTIKCRPQTRQRFREAAFTHNVTAGELFDLLVGQFLDKVNYEKK